MAHLQSGTTIGPYRIDALVGEGGMGAVYRATDTRLHRTVAIKLLRPELTADADSQARFEREGRLLATLNHPNVAAIHGLEQIEHTRALVLEFVEGKTLAELLAASRLSLTQSLSIARQIALALAAAHDKGIVHRDLKPANIKITPSGDVKVLDFGIAKLTSSNDELPQATITTKVQPTEIGSIIGTAAYMSPEQARGQTVDKRTDIWAFGCVLYEMLAGRRAFDGGTWSDTIAKVLEREPDWDALPKDAPAPIRAMVRRCLQKSASERRQDLADVPFEIAGAMSSTSSPVSHVPVGVNARQSRSLMAIAAVALGAILAAWLWSVLGSNRAGSTTGSSAVEFGVMFPENYYPSAGIAVSPDGRYIAAGVFSSDDEIWLHSLESSETRPTVTGDGPFWSPDSRTLAYCNNDGLRTMPVPDGPPTKIADVCGDGTWNRRRQIVMAVGGKLQTLSDSGGTLQPIPVPEGRVASAPQFLPDDRHLIYTDSIRGVGPIVVTALDGQDHREIGTTDAPAVFVPPDHLLFVRGTALVAQTFDPDRLELQGEPSIVVPNVLLGLQVGRRARISGSATGVLAYGKPLGGSNGQLTWFDRQGRKGASIPPHAGGEFLSPAISPDGRFLAAHRMDPLSGNWDIWTVDLEQGTPSRLTTNPALDADPIWSPDGKEIVFASDRDSRLGLYRKSADGSGTEQLLVTVEGSTNLVPSDWSRDGRYIIYHHSRPDPARVFALPTFGDRTPIHLLGPEFNTYAARVSPDGKWLSYTSFESGPQEVYVQRFLEPGQKQKISNGGGGHARWTSNGRELTWHEVLGGVAAVDFISDGTSFRIGPRRPIVEVPVLSLIDGRTKWDITLDGTRILARQPAGPQGPGIGVILNWTQRIRQTN